jgi:hypothetical protein
MKICFPRGAACLPTGGYVFCYFTLRRFPIEAERIAKKSKAEKIAAGQFWGSEGSTSSQLAPKSPIGLLQRKAKPDQMVQTSQSHQLIFIKFRHHRG